MKNIKLKIAALTLASSIIMSMSGCSKEESSTNVEFKFEKATNYFSDEVESLSMYDKLKYIDVYLTYDNEIVLLTKIGRCEKQMLGTDNGNHFHYQDVVTNETFIGHTYHKTSDDEIPEKCLENRLINDDLGFFTKKSSWEGNITQYLNYTEMDKIINNEFTHEDLTAVALRLQEQYDDQKKLVKRRDYQF